MTTATTLRLLKRGVSRGLLNLLRQNQWVAALGALCGVLILVQMLVLILLGLEGMQAILRSRTDLRLEISAEATEAEVQNFFSELVALPAVRDGVYITREKAYEQTRLNDPELIAFLEEFHIQNPFADTIGVTLRNLDDYDAFRTFVQGPQWQHIINPTFLSDVSDQENQVYSLLSLTRAGRSLTMIILAITMVALIFITTELIHHRAAARSDEVLVERLVGATPLSIAVPFVTEAVVLLLIAIALSIAVLLVLLVLLPVMIPALQPGGVLGSLRAQVEPLLRSMLPLWVLLEILAVPLIAVAGAWLGIHRQVQSPRIAFAL